MYIIYDHKHVATEFEERLRQAEWEHLVEKVRASGNAPRRRPSQRLSDVLAVLNVALKASYWPAAAG